MSFRKFDPEEYLKGNYESGHGAVFGARGHIIYAHQSLIRTKPDAEGRIRKEPDTQGSFLRVDGTYVPINVAISGRDGEAARDLLLVHQKGGDLVDVLMTLQERRTREDPKRFPGLGEVLDVHGIRFNNGLTTFTGDSQYVGYWSEFDKVLPPKPRSWLVE